MTQFADITVSALATGLLAGAALAVSSAAEAQDELGLDDLVAVVGWDAEETGLCIAAGYAGKINHQGEDGLDRRAWMTQITDIGWRRIQMERFHEAELDWVREGLWDESRDPTLEQRVEGLIAQAPADVVTRVFNPGNEADAIADACLEPLMALDGRMGEYLARRIEFYKRYN